MESLGDSRHSDELALAMGPYAETMWWHKRAPMSPGPTFVRCSTAPVDGRTEVSRLAATGPLLYGTDGETLHPGVRECSERWGADRQLCTGRVLRRLKCRNRVPPRPPTDRTRPCAVRRYSGTVVLPHGEDLVVEAWSPGTGLPNGLHELRKGLSTKGRKARSAAAILITEVVRPRSPHQLPGRHRPRVGDEGNNPTKVFARRVRQLVAHHGNPNDRHPSCRLPG